MKNIFVIYLILSTLSALGQTDTTVEFLKDIVENQKMGYEGEVRISSVSTAWTREHLKKLIKPEDSGSISFFFSRRDTLHLTANEKELIIEHFSDPSNLQVSGEPWNFDTIGQRRVVGFLKNNEGSQVLFLSKPLFIRDGTVAISFFSNLCCGGISGSINVSAYRKEDHVWTRWIDLSAGEF